MTEFVRIGEQVPALTLPDLDGNAVNLDDFRGQRVLAFLWASW